MYIDKMKTQQIDEMLKEMMLQEAETTSFYKKNLPKIMDGTLFKYKVVKDNNNTYIVSIVENGDVFIFDDCNYIKFEMPSLQPISFQKNTAVYNNYMRDKFKGYYDFEKKYNTEAENIVNIVNFCEETIRKYKDKLHGSAVKNVPKPRASELEF